MSLLVNQLNGFNVGASAAVPAGPIEIAETASPATDSGTGTTITFSGVSIGTAAADRMVVVSVSLYTGTPRSITGVTIAGETAIEDEARASGTYKVYIFSAMVSSGTTGDIELTFNGTDGLRRTCINVYRVVGGSKTVTTATGNTSVSADQLSLSSFAIPTDGGAIFCVCIANVNAITWTNATEQADVDIFVGRAGHASSVTAGTATRTANGGNASVYALCGVAWE
jgi:hypothetical protein